MLGHNSAWWILIAHYMCWSIKNAHDSCSLIAIKNAVLWLTFSRKVIFNYFIVFSVLEQGTMQAYIAKCIFKTWVELSRKLKCLIVLEFGSCNILLAVWRSLMSRSSCQHMTITLLDYWLAGPKSCKFWLFSNCNELPRLVYSADNLVLLEWCVEIQSLMCNFISF